MAKNDLMDFIKAKMKPAKSSSVEVEIESEDPESSDVDETEVMAEELISAIKDGDAKGVVETLRALIEQIKE
jgi:hypothetical protein